MYEKGQGVEQNHQEAKSWYEKAAQQGNVEAQQALDRINLNEEES
jgi:TPR repeat protein